MTEQANGLAYSALDSRRFGLKVYRGTAASLVDREFFRQVLAEGIDVAILRTPADGSSSASRLQRFGFPMLHADTLVYYSVDLERFAPAPLRNADLAFTEATEDDKAPLAALVAETFANYSSHYHANPNFAASDILAGYLEWAASYVGDAQEGRITWVARRHGDIVAFACCTFDAGERGCEGVLYGVHPAHAGGGLYGDLIRHTQAQFKSRGFQSMRVSTQVWNHAVQKVWAREGFALSGAYDTYHVNAMLSAGDLKIERELTFSSAQVAQFAAASGDTNPVHLDEARAREAGFDGCISHGMLAGAELSRIFGTEIPGAGTLFLRSNLVFAGPVYADRPHLLRVRYLQQAGSSVIQAIATLQDARGHICLLAYNDLLVKG